MKAFAVKHKFTQKEKNKHKNLKLEETKKKKQKKQVLLKIKTKKWLKVISMMFGNCNCREVWQSIVNLSILCLLLLQVAVSSCGKCETIVNF